jgi:hypothetical protein
MVIKYDILQVLDEYQKSFGESWRSIQADSTQTWPYLDEALVKFQACNCLFFIILASVIFIKKVYNIYNCTKKVFFFLSFFLSANLSYGGF